MTALRNQLMIALIAAGLASSAAGQAPLAVWSVDPHLKVFRDAQPAQSPGAIKMRAARNEFEPGQLAIRSSAAVAGLRVEVSPLRHADGKAAIGPEHLQWNFVGFIPLTKNTQRSEAIQIRPAPCEVPDPLMDNRTMDLPAGTTQPVWLTVFVPKDAEPGLYRGEAAVEASGWAAGTPVAGCTTVALLTQSS